MRIRLESFTKTDLEAFWEEVLEKDELQMQISEMKEIYPEKSSIDVPYSVLDDIDVEIAFFISRKARPSIEIGNKLLEKMINYDQRFDEVKPQIRITNLPPDMKRSLGKIRSYDVGKLISVTGMVKKVYDSKVVPLVAMFKCRLCDTMIPIGQDSIFLNRPVMCTAEGCKKTVANQFEYAEDESVLSNIQQIVIESAPGDTVGQPRSLDCMLRGDLLDRRIDIGSTVVLNGYLKYRDKRPNDDTAINDFILEAISVESDSSATELVVTDEDVKEFEILSADDDILGKLAESLAPTIYGYFQIKKALVLQLVGGTEVFFSKGPNQNGSKGERKRGDIHILIIGDPGIAKSQLLRAVSKMHQRSQFISGSGSSKAGLTATAVKEDDVWSIEAGALPLADGGIACIDELDKMKDNDKASLHEAMESQVLNIAKAGKTVTLRTKCSILAAANPKDGRYNPATLISDQINLGDTLLSRFDLIYALSDIPDEDKDEKICQHILSGHRIAQARSAQDYHGMQDLDSIKALKTVDPSIPHDTMVKYLAYARKITPVMTVEAYQILDDTYNRIRSMGAQSGITSITARQLDGLVRLSTAMAKIHLRQDITADDAKEAARMVEDYLNALASDGEGCYDSSRIMSSISNAEREVIKDIKDLFANDYSLTLSRQDILDKVKGSNVPNVIDKMLRNETLMEPHRGIAEYRLRRFA